MGQMIDEEDCEVCKPFDQEWIFTYGDLVTLLFCFFVLLVSLCKTDVEKIKQISASFKENPPGSPFVFSGQSSNLDKAAQQLEKLDVQDDVEINASDKGVEVTFRRTVSFEQGSTEISEKAVKAMKKMLPIIGQMQNDIEISGHTDDTDVNNRFPSNWEMSVARASAIAGFVDVSRLPIVWRIGDAVASLTDPLFIWVEVCSMNHARSCNRPAPSSVYGDVRKVLCGVAVVVAASSRIGLML